MDLFEQKKTATYVAASFLFGCLTWIRTKTNCTKNSRATVTQSGNPLAILRMECKNRGRHKNFQIFIGLTQQYLGFGLT